MLSQDFVIVYPIKRKTDFIHAQIRFMLLLENRHTSIRFGANYESLALKRKRRIKKFVKISLGFMVFSK